LNTWTRVTSDAPRPTMAGLLQAETVTAALPASNTLLVSFIVVTASFLLFYA
jgi:hypothetical protein